MRVSEPFWLVSKSWTEGRFRFDRTHVNLEKIKSLMFKQVGRNFGVAHLRYSFDPLPSTRYCHFRSVVS